MRRPYESPQHSLSVQLMCDELCLGLARTSWSVDSSGYRNLYDWAACHLPEGSKSLARRYAHSLRDTAATLLP